MVGVGVATLVAAVAPAGERFDPRELRDARVEIDDALSPLATLKGQLGADEPADLFTVRLDGAPEGLDRVRVAALDQYDGALWTASGDYRLTDGPVESQPHVGGDGGTRVRARVTVEGLDGPFVPVVGFPTSVSGAGAGGGATVAVDASTGVVVSTRARSERIRVDVEARVTIVSDEEVAAATPNRAGELAAVSRAPDDLPPALRQRAQAWAAEAETYGGELLAIRDHLLGVAYADSEATPPGHSYAALVRMFEGEPGERTGYAEQFASAFVLMARERQVPARVAVGYLLPEAGDDGTYTVTEAQAHAWPEVNLSGVGWVAIEPTDLAKINAADDEAAEEPPGGPGDSPEKRSAPAPAADGAAAGPGEEGSGAAGLARRAAAGGALLLALAVLAVAGRAARGQGVAAGTPAPGTHARRVGSRARGTRPSTGCSSSAWCWRRAARPTKRRAPPRSASRPRWSAGSTGWRRSCRPGCTPRSLPTTSPPARPGEASRWSSAPCAARRACVPGCSPGSTLARCGGVDPARAPWVGEWPERRLIGCDKRETAVVLRREGQQ